MQLVIDIPKDAYDYVMGCGYFPTNFNMLYEIRNGTPIPDNATVGEVFCMLACKEPICETASYFTIGKDLWNAPYQKGGKE